MKTTLRRVVSGFALVSSLVLASPQHALSMTLGSASSFAVLGASTVTNTGPSLVSGNLGVAPGTAVTGFGPGSVTNGAIHAGDAVASAAHSDALIAYAALLAMVSPPANDLSGRDLGGMTLVPGVYHFASSAQLSGILTLDARGDRNALFVFQIGSTLVTAVGSKVVMINDGGICPGANVFWQVTSSATIGTATAFVGHILALASITLNANVSISGSALAMTAAVTMDTDNISVCSSDGSSSGSGGGKGDKGDKDGKGDKGDKGDKDGKGDKDDKGKGSGKDRDHDEHDKDRDERK